jgi:hypothetical protein
MANTYQREFGLVPTALAARAGGGRGLWYRAPLG